MADLYFGTLRLSGDLRIDLSLSVEFDKLILEGDADQVVEFNSVGQGEIQSEKTGGDVNLNITEASISTNFPVDNLTFYGGSFYIEDRGPIASEDVFIDDSSVWLTGGDLSADSVVISNTGFLWIDHLGSSVSTRTSTGAGPVYRLEDTEDGFFTDVTLPFSETTPSTEVTLGRYNVRSNTPVNFARCLVANIPSDQNVNTPGWAFIPPDYVPTSESPALARLRDIVFGPSPDAYMLNYRTTQLLSITESTPLQSLLEALDDRFTYQDPNLFEDNLFGVNVSPEFTSTKWLYVAPDTKRLDDYVFNGQLYYRYSFQVTDASTVSIRQIEPSRYSTEVSRDYTVTNQASSPVLFPNLPLYGAFRGDTGDQWFASYLARPTVTLPEIVHSVQQAGGLFESLCPTDRIQEEPFRTLNQVWYYFPEMSYKIAVLTILLITSAYEIKTGRSFSDLLVT